jgi:hypothetical protein
MEMLESIAFSQRLPARAVVTAVLMAYLLQLAVMVALAAVAALQGLRVRQVAPETQQFKDLTAEQVQQ